MDYLKPRRLTSLWIITVFLVLVAVRLPALLRPVNLSPDATEYIDIARNFAAGEGLVLKIRGYFLGDGLGVPYPATALRSPLFPALLGASYKIIPSEHIFAWFNFCVFLGNMVLLALILCPHFPGKVVVYALLLVGLSEPMFLTSIFPWAEQTAFFWLLLELLLINRQAHVRWGVPGAMLEGLVAGLAYLSRPEYILVGLLSFAWLLRGRQRAGASALGFAGGFIPPLATFFGWNLVHHGRTFLPGEYLLRARDYAVYFTWERSSEQRAFSFLATNYLWISGRILRNAVNYFAKLVGWKNLFGLAAALPLMFWKVFRGEYPGQIRRLAQVPAVFFCAYCLVWAGMDRERYLLSITTFLIPLCLLELDQSRQQTRHPWVGYVCLVLLVVNLPASLTYVISSNSALSRRTGLDERFYARQNPAWANPDILELASWVRNNIALKEVICAENPFLVNYLTRRPAIVVPQGVRPEEFRNFLSFYGVRYWVNNTIFTKRSVEELERLESVVAGFGGTELARCGSYRIWKIP